VLFLVGFTAWGTLRVSALRSSQQPTSTALSISDVLLETPLAGASMTPSLPAQTGQFTALPGSETTAAASALPQETLNATLVSLPGAATPTPDFGGAPVQVYLVVRQRAWMRISVDGEVVFEGRVIPGSAYPFAAEGRIELVTGNGAGLQVFFNQQDLGVLGLFGEVVERVFTVQGVVVPTPAVPPTFTPAPTSTPTPRGTPGPTLIITP
jgi:cytoskeleton protein RodZ